MSENNTDQAQAPLPAPADPNHAPVRRLGWRPLAAAPLPLLLVLLVAWLIQFGYQICETDMTFRVALAVATVCIITWANHVAHARQPGAVPNVIGRSAYDLFGFGMLLFLCLLPWQFIGGVVDCHTDRSRISELYLGATTYRETIAERAKASGTLAHAGRGLTVEPLGLRSGGLVTEDGVVILASEQPVAVLFFNPRLEGGEVKWTCRGHPRRSMPWPCAGEKTAP